MRYRFLRFPGGKPKAVTLSYDDGIIQDERFSDLLQKYNIKCTFNINGKSLRAPEKDLPDDVIKKCILDRGHEVAVHGLRHKAEGTLRPISGIRDVLDCRLDLEKRFGIIIRGMAYPDSGITRYPDNNTDYETIKNYLKELDIAYSRTLSGDNSNFFLPSDWHRWMPTAHHYNPEIFNYIKEFVNIDFNSPKIYGAHRFSRLFYLWGHSYEFDNEHNGKSGWEHIEKICKELGGRDDIWYATNIEIHDYVEAYHSIRYSADETIMYNPTLYTLWFEIDSKLYSINPGETIKVEE